ncbi:MAG TPA: hypothetical protein VMY42_02700 [Thermoguttaceae bacterium]|nr:hypothetical protein [Thermoguttaceae bacterium]
MLNLDQTGIRDGNLQPLAGIKNLKVLFLEYNRDVTDASQPLFARMRTLVKLDLVDSGVSDAGLEQLRQTLPNCEIP